MSCYREAPEALEAAARSVLDQQVDETVELVLVNDDPTNEELVSWQRSFAEREPRLVALFNEENRGLTASLNRALGTASGHYIARMDADDLALPGRLQHQKDYLEDNGLDLVGGKVRVTDEEGGLLYEVSDLPATPEAVKKALRWNNCVPHPTWFGRREVFADGYREVPLCEDYDFLLRASLAGRRLGNLQEAVGEYRISTGGISQSNLYRQYLYQVYLSDQYRHGKVVDPAVATAFVEGRYDEKAAGRYSQGNDRVNGGLEKLRSGDPWGAVVGVLGGAFTTPSNFDKVMRLGMAALHGRSR